MERPLRFSRCFGLYAGAKWMEDVVKNEKVVNTFSTGNQLVFVLCQRQNFQTHLELVEVRLPS